MKQLTESLLFELEKSHNGINTKHCKWNSVFDREVVKMLLRELVLESLEPIGKFAIQKHTENGGMREERLTDETYEKFVDYEIAYYFLDVDKENNRPYISVKLVEYQQGKWRK